MALGPGPVGLKFWTAQGIAGSVTTPDYWGTSQGELVTKLERVVYDQTATPVFIAPAATPQSLAEVAGNIVRRVLVGSLTVFATASAMAEPVFVPSQVTTAAFASSDNVRRSVRIDQSDDGYAAPPLTSFATATPSAFDYQAVEATWRQQRKVLPEGFTEAVSPPTAAVTPFTGTLASVHGSATVVLSRVVYDQTAARPVFPPAPGGTVTSSLVPADGPQSGFARQRIKPVQLSAFVFAYQIDDLANNDGYEDAFVRIIRAKRKILPDSIAQPPFQPVTVTPPAVAPLACAYSSSTVVLSQVVYDPAAARPVFPPVVVVVPPTFYQADEGAPQRRVSRPGIKLDLEGFERPTTQQQTLFWFETYTALKARPISLAAVKTNLDGYDRPVIQITVTPSFLFETIPPPWTAKPNATAIKADLDGFQHPDQLPAPPTSTPAILFDVIPAVQQTLPNRIAIKTNLDGAVWPPQRPEDLTGVIFVPPTTIGRYPTGGESYWHVTHKKPGKKSTKRCRFINIDGVLTWICGRLTSERLAEARLQALDLVYDAAGGDLEPLYETLQLEQTTNASEARRNAATLLLRAIREARRLEVETKSVEARRQADAAAQKAAAAANKAALQEAVAQEAVRYEASIADQIERRAVAAAHRKALQEAAAAAQAQRQAEKVQRQAEEAERRAEQARAELIQAEQARAAAEQARTEQAAEQARLAMIDEEDDDMLLLD